MSVPKLRFKDFSGDWKIRYLYQKTGRLRTHGHSVEFTLIGHN